MKKILALVLMLMLCMSLLYGCGSSSDKTYSKTCKVCHRTFSYKGSEYGNNAQKNASNISRTNMCLNCYNNYKWASGY